MVNYMISDKTFERICTADKFLAQSPSPCRRLNNGFRFPHMEFTIGPVLARRYRVPDIRYRPGARGRYRFTVGLQSNDSPGPTTNSGSRFLVEHSRLYASAMLLNRNLLRSEQMHRAYEIVANYRTTVKVKSPMSGRVILDYGHSYCFGL